MQKHRHSIPLQYSYRELDSNQKTNHSRFRLWWYYKRSGFELVSSDGGPSVFCKTSVGSIQKVIARQGQKLFQKRMKIDRILQNCKQSRENVPYVAGVERQRLEHEDYYSLEFRLQCNNGFYKVL